MAPRPINSSDAYKDWADAYVRYEAEGQSLAYPSETLIRMLKGRYMPGLGPEHQGKRALDIGCGSGNNLMLLGTLGCELYGTEVEESLCRETEGRLADLNLQADIRVGYNHDLPFEDQFFDLIISWSVIHYASTAKEIRANIGEYARVLRPGGHLLVLTTGPDHKITQDAEKLDANRYVIGREDDFRKGQVFWYFASKDQVTSFFAESFDAVHVGRVRDELLTETLDHFLVGVQR